MTKVAAVSAKVSEHKEGVFVVASILTANVSAGFISSCFLGFRVHQ